MKISTVGLDLTVKLERPKWPPKVSFATAFGDQPFETGAKRTGLTRIDQANFDILYLVQTHRVMVTRGGPRSVTLR
ncbi:hypothetical protein GNZ12_26890 [Paraburkholderia sp. 1N]|uniref:Uncharacterized protein n=1 Tax=Paraburkholderia solitsugae TaxID=2675748 RepID=A0ABX2BW53_9BURK|nr:hypothetical protein [Paraburkholderia solitsugae]NPT44879.1 hypothetical protein [Paraburkholderia solitsugae]